VRNQIDTNGKRRQNHTSHILIDLPCEQPKDALDPIQLLEIAAHDLRNPISGILAASQYLLEDARSVLDESQLAMLGSIDSSSRSMLRLIDDLTELSAIESGKLRLDVKTTDLCPLLAHALSSSRAVADRKKVQLDLEADCKPSLPLLDIDPEKVFRALERLLTSTVMLTGQGGKILVGMHSRAGRATISLRVEGCAASAAAVRTLFSPFRKRRMSRSGVEGGTALALAKVTRIVEAHGGVIRVERSAEKELTIKLSFPLPKRTAEPRHAAGAG
jgi:signal transduction histidine kinase